MTASMAQAQEQHSDMLWFAVALVVFQAVAAMVWLYYIRKRGRTKLAFGKRPFVASKDEYDAIVIGANVAGFTAAYYIAKEGKKVILLTERGQPASYGGPWCAPSCGVLKNMNLLEPLKTEEGLLQLPTRGGFVSPAGFVCKLEEVDDKESCDMYPTYAVTRSAMEKHLRSAAEGAGCTVVAKGLQKLSRSGDEERQIWSAMTEGGDEHKALFVVDCGGVPMAEGLSAASPTTGCIALGLDGTPTRASQVAPKASPRIPKSYADGYLLAGLAAGHVDPLTAESDRLSMLGARYAGIFAAQLLGHGDTSESNCEVYHYRCYEDFMHRIPGQARVAAMLHRLPWILDALVSTGQGRGDFLRLATEAMAGARPRYHFLWPDWTISVTWEALMQLLRISAPPKPKKE